MKKTIFFAFLLLIATAGVASEKLTLKLAPGGPEHGTLKAYQIIGVDEAIHDSIAGGKFLEIKERNYFGMVYVVGEGFDYDRIIMAYKGLKNWKTEQPIEEKAGFSHWGFVKKYQIKTPITTYSRISQTPPIVSVKNELIYSRNDNFHFGSVVALFFLLVLGMEIGTAIFYPKKWWKMRREPLGFYPYLLFYLIVSLATMIYCLVWSYNVSAPFVYLAMAVILIGIMPNAWRKIFPGKKAKKISVIKATPG